MPIKVSGTMAVPAFALAVLGAIHCYDFVADRLGLSEKSKEPVATTVQPDNRRNIVVPLPPGSFSAYENGEASPCDLIRSVADDFNRKAEEAGSTIRMATDLPGSRQCRVIFPSAYGMAP